SQAPTESRRSRVSASWRARSRSDSSSSSARSGSASTMLIRSVTEPMCAQHYPHDPSSAPAAQQQLPDVVEVPVGELHLGWLGLLDEVDQRVGEAHRVM